MKTDDLITALARDAVIEPDARRTLLRAVPVSAVVVAAAFFATLGLRPDVSSAMPATMMKLSFTLTLAISGFWLAQKLARGDAGRGAEIVLLAGFAVIVLFSMIDLGRNGLSGAGLRMIGSKGLHCLTLVPVFSALPLAAFLFALRRGVVRAPVLAGLAAGIAASGIGATVYALNCMDDSPLFLLLWYSIAIALVSAVAVAASIRLLRW